MEYIENTEFETNEQFEINDDSAAEWALKKVLLAKSERERLLGLIEAERAELDRKEEKVEKRYESETAFLLSKLNAYLEKVESKKTKTQETYQLLSGKLVRKFAKLKLVPDKPKLLDWCKENAPDCVKVTEEAKWADVKGKFAVVGDNVIFAETGEFVSCVSVEEEPSVFDVKAD